MAIDKGDPVAVPARSVDDTGFVVEPGVIPPVTDPLSDTLQRLRMDGMFYCRSELTDPWGIELPAMEGCLWFHVVTEGSCLLVADGGEQIEITAGDMVVLPRGHWHRAATTDEVATPVVFDQPHEYLSSRYAILRHGGGGARTRIVCGVVRLGNPGARSLLDLLPETLVIHGAEPGRRQWLTDLLSLMASETHDPQLGSEAMVTRLCDILVVQAIRHWVEQTPVADQGWLGALRDPQVGPALLHIHRRPDHPWSVAELASAVGLSRSAFAARFTAQVGRPVKEYLTEWRMELARDLLAEGLAIAEIAQQLGYGSEAAFSRAYKRVVGEAPSVTRRAELDAAAAAVGPPPAGLP
ncbi:MAG: AraC family transcriptional regulator [Actinomycetota bacterium]